MNTRRRAVAMILLRWYFVAWSGLGDVAARAVREASAQARAAGRDEAAHARPGPGELSRPGTHSQATACGTKGLGLRGAQAILLAETGNLLLIRRRATRARPRGIGARSSSATGP